MRILLIGEYSGLFNDLKAGLKSLGHEVFLWADGDGFKNFSSDAKIYRNINSCKTRKVIDLYWDVRNKTKFDIVQLVCPVPFPAKFGINKNIINYLIKNNNKLFISGAGSSSMNTILAEFCKEKYKYPQLFESLKNDNGTMWSLTDEGRRFNSWLFQKIDGYIPIMYEYAQPYREVNHPKLRETIPLPLNIDSVEYKDNKVKEKMVFFHGINREGVKGTPLIVPAMERLKEKYPNDVEIVVDGKMPIDTYIKLLETVNVVIDQAYSVSYGMNALYAMAKGKIVVGGGEEECLKEFGFAETPIVPIYPSIDDIYNKLVNVLERKTEILEWGHKSRKFVEENHNHIKIASRYLEVWKNS